MSDYHEPFEALDEDARDAHRALTSLKEEIEAVDWYHQRVALCCDPALRAVLAHNRDDEIEHACMTLEWLRRREPRWDEMLRRFLFREGATHEREDESARGDGDGAPAREPGDLGVRSLRPRAAAGKEA